MRRKLKRVLELGFIVEKGQLWAEAGVLQQPEHQIAFVRGLQQTVQFMNERLGNGVVR